MLKVRNFAKIICCLGLCSFVGSAYAEDQLIKDAKENYLKLALPPTAGNPMEQYTYSGPTEAEAKTDPIKQLKRDFVENRSAVTEKIPDKREEVQLNWKILPAKWGN
jgi:hypothetical protein